MGLVTARHADEAFLARPVRCVDMAAARATLAGVLRRHRHYCPAKPALLVFQLAPECRPALIENRPVQAGLGLDVLPRLRLAAFGRSAHVGDFQILDTDQRVVFADGCRGLVEKVTPHIGDGAVQLLDLGFGLDPVLAELLLARHRPLVAREALLVFLETVQWGDRTTVRQGGKARNAEVNADGSRCRMQRRVHFPLSLDGNEPFPARLAHRHILWRAEHLAAIAVAQPAELGQEDAAIDLIQLETLRKPEAVMLAAFPEGRVVGDPVEEPLVSRVQVFQRVLKGLGGRLIENETASPGEAARIALLAAVFHHFELVCLASFHGMDIIGISLEKHGHLRRPRLISSS